MRENLKQISPVLWEIPIGTIDGMNVPARMYVAEDMLEQVYRDNATKQLVNVTTLPGIETCALVMPDVHEGYGFPIGGVAAMDLKDGVISPGGIGYDINCGIRLLKTKFVYDEIKNSIARLADEIYRFVPSGVGTRGPLKLRDAEMDKVLNLGCRWAEDEGYTEEGDLKFIESSGSMESADSHSVSQHAKDRGRNQLGTMGGGNHFVEIDVVNKLLDEETARAFGLFEGQVVIQIHTGSRGLGHQVATDYIKIMLNAAAKFGIQLRDRELACAPIDSPEGETYFAAMSASANYAWTNRQMITHEVRQAWENVMGKAGGRLQLLYDVAHNIAKIEQHIIDGNSEKVLVHRKGATRAFPAGNVEVPPEFRAYGQPVLIPGSMGTASYVLAGLPGSMENSFGSACHGSGRTMSRTAARKKIQGAQLKEQLEKRGIVVETGSMRGLAEEAPDAYKDVETVVDVVEQAGIAKKVARLKPLAVVKG